MDYSTAALIYAVLVMSFCYGMAIDDLSKRIEELDRKNSTKREH